MDTMLRNTICALVIGLAVAGCATPTTRSAGVDPGLADAEKRKQEDIAIETGHQANERATNVAYPLLVAATKLCGDQAKPTLGFAWFNLYDYTDRDRGAVVRLYDMDEAPKAMYVPHGSPAHAAGIQKGDTLLTLGGRPVPTGKSANERWKELTMTTLRVGEPVSITIRRAGAEKQLQARPVLACDFGIAVFSADAVNAFANGRAIATTAGMLRFVQDDRELALVLAHEIAHNAMKHMEAMQRNSGFGSVLDILLAVKGINTRGAFGRMAAQTYSKDFEAEADYVGLYIMARTGLPIDNAPAFWRRMAAANPGSIRGGGFLASHPATPERFVAMEQTVAEIKDKQARKLPLEPEYKKPAPAAEPEKTETGETP